MPDRFPLGGWRLVVATTALVCLLFAAGVGGGVLLQTARPKTSAAPPRATAPASARPPPQRYVLSAADLGPDYEQLRAGPATLGAATEVATGWDVVYRSSSRGTLVESIAVVYPSEAAAAAAAGTMEAMPEPGTARVVRAAGTVLIVVVVVAGTGDTDPGAIAGRASDAEMARVTAARR